jgi:hypothetical protein
MMYNMTREATYFLVLPWAYVSYYRRIRKHTGHVRNECLKAGIPAQGAGHDESKFSHAEFWASARWHLIQESWVTAVRWAWIVEKGEQAWESHYRRNPHHPEYWIGQDGTLTPMSEHARLEMLCDWIAVEKSYPGSDSAAMWYYRKQEGIPLHPETREFVESYLGPPITNLEECT